jgi:hypothetical protein
MPRVLVARAALAVAGATVLVGCGGGGAKNPGIASLASSKSGGTTATVSKQSVAQLYNLWAQCMRQHGVNMPDPTVDGQGQISVNAGNVSPAIFESANKACAAQHDAAQKAAGGGPGGGKPPDPSKMLAFSKCMRGHGLADFPDPSGNGLRIKAGSGSDLSPDNPAFQKAQKACQPILGSLKGGEKTQVGGPGPGSGGGPSGGPSGGSLSGG